MERNSHRARRCWHFLAGFVPRFFRKYQEANLTAQEMLPAPPRWLRFRQANQCEYAVQHKQARDHSPARQGNDCYWHGVFGEITHPTCAQTLAKSDPRGRVGGSAYSRGLMTRVEWWIRCRRRAEILSAPAGIPGIAEALRWPQPGVS